MAQQQQTKQATINMLFAALRRIEAQTRGYDAMCTMGCLNEIAKAAIAATPAQLKANAKAEGAAS